MNKFDRRVKITKRRIKDSIWQQIFHAGEYDISIEYGNDGNSIRYNLNMFPTGQLVNLQDDYGFPDRKLILPDKSYVILNEHLDQEGITLPKELFEL